MAKVDQPRIPKGFVGAGRFMKAGQALIAIAKDASHRGDGDGRKRGTSKLAKAGAKLAPSVKVKAPSVAPSREDAARRRQARIDEAMGIADLSAEIDELRDYDTGVAETRRRVDAMLRRNAGNAKLAALAKEVAAAESLDEMDQVVRGALAGHRLERVGVAGKVEPFDRTKHKPIGQSIPDGAHVVVVRPGHDFTDETGEKVRLSKAVVEEATPDEIAAATAPTTASASVWAGVPDWAADPEVNAAVADRKAHRADMAARLKTGVKAGEVTGPRALAAVPSGLHTAGALTRMTKDQRDFLRQYRGTAFPNINGALRRERGDLPEHFGFEFHREAVGHLDAVMERSKLREDVVVHRGVMDGREVFGPAFGRDMTGAEWTEHAYVSTSADPNVVLDERFFSPDGGAVLRIRAPKGTGAAALSDGTYESEILLQRGLKMKVLSDTGPGPDRVIEVGIVHDKPRRSPAARPGSRAAGDAAAVDGLPGRADDAGRGRAGSGAVAAPAPRLAKAGAKLAPSPTEVAAQLSAATSRDQAHQMIAGLSVAQLRQLAAQLKVPVGSRDNKTALRNIIVGLAVGRRLDSFAINPGRKPS